MKDGRTSADTAQQPRKWKAQHATQAKEVHISTRRHAAQYVLGGEMSEIRVDNRDDGIQRFLHDNLMHAAKSTAGIGKGS